VSGSIASEDSLMDASSHFDKSDDGVVVLIDVTRIA